MIVRPRFSARCRAVALATALAAIALATALAARADAGAASAAVERLHEALLSTMREADSLGYPGRRDRLSPVIRARFDLAFISEIVLGRSWSDLSEADRARMVEAFSALTVATYAARFDGFDGESFRTVETRDLKRGRILVRAELVKGNGDTVKLDYVLHDAGGGDWRIVNVVADGVSELALKRAEYSTILKAQGFDSLVVQIEAQTADYAAGREE